MNLDHCMYLFHDSLLINCYQKFEINQEVHSWYGIPALWEVVRELSTRRCTRMTHVLIWFGIEVRKPPTFYGLNDKKTFN
jgi:hypothetical protein